jgi:hypothetical protein
MNEQPNYRGFFSLPERKLEQLVSPVGFIPHLSSDETIVGAPVMLDALWDTGSNVSCISSSAYKRLKLVPFGADESGIISGVGGTAKTSMTIATIYIFHNLIVEYCPFYVVTFDDKTFDLIIGMDIITMGDFAVCNTGGKTSFSFAIPSFPDRINFADKADKLNFLNKKNYDSSVE